MLNDAIQSYIHMNIHLCIPDNSHFFQDIVKEIHRNIRTLPENITETCLLKPCFIFNMRES